MGLEEIRNLKEKDKLSKPKIRKPIPKKSAKKLKQEAEEKIARKISGGGELERWFEARRKEMKGVCSHCGNRTHKHSDRYYRHSVAHLLPKRLFKSVATHSENWLELCYFPPSCHTNFDQNLLDWVQLNCFDEVIRKFVAIYPSIAPNERKYIPDILLQYVAVDK